jgi:ribosomal protein RSM22 (predicted rRNA methylase)
MRWAAPSPNLTGATSPLASRVRASIALAKGGEVPWEDEKFAYLIASRTPVQVSPARVLSPPQSASGRVQLKLCKPDGTAATRLVTRREGETFKQARRADWGDAFEG